MELGFLRKIKISTSLIMLCIIFCPLSKTFSEDKTIFTDDDLDTYQYGNGKTESAVIENADRTPEKIGATSEATPEEKSFRRRLETLRVNIRASK
jgi:hypothetical protein